MDYSPPGSLVHGIDQARILEWVAVLSSRGSSQPRDRTQISCNAGRFFMSETPGKQITLILSPSFLCAGLHPLILSLRIFLFFSDLFKCLLSCSFLTFNLIVCSIEVVRCPRGERFDMISLESYKENNTGKLLPQCFLLSSLFAQHRKNTGVILFLPFLTSSPDLSFFNFFSSLWRMFVLAPSFNNKKLQHLPPIDSIHALCMLPFECSVNLNWLLLILCLVFIAGDIISLVLHPTVSGDNNSSAVFFYFLLFLRFYLCFSECL